MTVVLVVAGGVVVLGVLVIGLAGMVQLQQGLLLRQQAEIRNVQAALYAAASAIHAIADGHRLLDQAISRLGPTQVTDRADEAKRKVDEMRAMVKPAGPKKEQVH